MQSRDNLGYPEWRARLLADAEQCGCKNGASQLTDAALELFWKSGVPPTVRAVIANAEAAKAS